MARVLGCLSVIAAAALATASLAGCGGTQSDDDAATATTAGGGAATTAKPQRLQGKARLVGDITVMYSAAASVEPISTPFTVTVPEAGRGGLDLPQAVVDGQQKSIVWTGGRPLPVTGACKLDLGKADMTVDVAGAHIPLDGAVRALTAGSCRFGSSVAVGSKGISSPVDSVSFTLPNDSDFTTSGGATVVVPVDRRYEGRDGKLGLVGKLRMTTEDDEFNAASVAVESGTWVVTISVSKTGVLHAVADVEGSLLVTRS